MADDVRCALLVGVVVASVHSASIVSESQRMVDFTEDNLWPDGIVPYRFDKIYARYKELQTSVLQAFAQLHALTCVRFVPVPESATSNDQALRSRGLREEQKHSNDAQSLLAIYGSHKSCHEQINQAYKCRHEQAVKVHHCEDMLSQCGNVNAYSCRHAYAAVRANSADDTVALIGDTNVNDYKTDIRL